MNLAALPHFRPTAFWPVLRILRMLLLVPAVMGLVTAGIAMVGDGIRVAAGFLIMSGLALGMSGLLGRLPPGHRPSVREVLAGAALGWLGVALVGTLPFLWVAWLGIAAEAGGSLWGPDHGPVSHLISALFESMSGFTSTGLSVIDRPDLLPVGLQWWRSFTQWVGGAGIILLAIAVVEDKTVLGRMYQAEGRDRTIARDVRLTLRYIWGLYLGMTVLASLVLFGLGLDAWSAVNIGMTSIATGGFALAPDSLASNSAAVQLAVTGFSLIGAISFIAYIHLALGDRPRFLANRQMHTLFALFLFGCCLVGLLHLHETDTLPVLDIVFQVASALGTAGFATVDLSQWSDPVLAALFLAMLVGGSAGSTAGGIKLRRFIVLFNTVGAYIRHIAREPHFLLYRPAALPRDVQPEPAGHLAVAVLILVLWLCAIFLGSLLMVVLTPAGTPLVPIVFDVTSAVSTVGLSARVISADLSDTAKLVLVFLMWMGRLEILPILVLATWLIHPSPEPPPAPPEEKAAAQARREDPAKNE